MRVPTQTRCSCTFCQRQSVKRHFSKNIKFRFKLCHFRSAHSQGPVSARGSHTHSATDITSDPGTMAREEWGTVTRDNGVMEASTGDTKTGSGGKTVRFVAGSSENTQCDNRQVKPRDSGARSPQLNMVQSLVPHLPGLEKDKVYVISGTDHLIVKATNL